MSSRDLPRVLVCCAADPLVRAIYARELSASAEIRFLDDAGDRRAGWLADAEVLISLLPHSDLLDAEWKNVRAGLLQVMTSGVNHLRFDVLPTETAVAALPGAQSAAIAEHALAMALTAAKRLSEFHSKLRHGDFDMMSTTLSLRGGTCCVVGLGDVGRAVARLFHAVGMNVTGINRSGRFDDPSVSRVGRPDDLFALLAEADVAVISAELNAQTLNLFGAPQLRAMKKDAVLINVARGRIVDQDALFAHLVAHPSFHAGIDVWWEEPFNEGRFHVRHPFFDLPNLVGTPHCASRIPSMPAIMAEAAAANTRLFLRTGTCRHVVPREQRQAFASQN